jgi:hypothetical protein
MHACMHAYTHTHTHTHAHTHTHTHTHIIHVHIIRSTLGPGVEALPSSWPQSSEGAAS